MPKRYIGDRAFYRRFFAIAIPIMLQNAITNVVALLDNVMVGQVGTLPMSGVSIVNSIFLVFNTTLFGAVSGAGIFTAQFYGSGNHEGVRHSFRYKTFVCLGIALLGILVFLLWGDPLIRLYLTGEGTAADATETLRFGREYLRIMLWGFLPFAMSNVYCSTLRENGETFVPMVAGISAVFLNLILNYILIFGRLGLPAMGVRGAAWATVISRFAELAVVAVWTHLHAERHPFIRGAYRSLHIPGALFLSITLTATPLLANEFAWSCAMALLNQCYSTCGLDVMPALNIATTLQNVSCVAHLAIGAAVGILTGQMLGADRSLEEVWDTSRKLIAVSFLTATVFAVIMGACSSLFPLLYNTTPFIRELAARMILVFAIVMPPHGHISAAYYILRSGGQTGITFLFDCGFLWACCVPVAFLLSRFTNIGILPLLIICQVLDLAKVPIGEYLLRQRRWMQNLTL